MPLVSFYTPCKHYKTKGGLVFWCVEGGGGGGSGGYRKRPAAWNRLKTEMTILENIQKLQLDSI